MEYAALILQLVDYDTDDERISRTNALYQFSELMQCKIFQLPDEEASHIVILPEDKLESLRAINAYMAFCHLYKIASMIDEYPK